MAVRKARAEDATLITELLEQLGYPSKLSSIEMRIKEHAASPLTELLVAEVEGKIVGFLSFHAVPMMHEDGTLGRITALVVHEGHRRQGIGLALVRAIEEIGRNSGCTRFEVTSSEKREGTSEFYEKMGYAQAPRRFVKGDRGP